MGAGARRALRGQEGETRRAEIQDATAPALEQLVRFLHTDTFDFGPHWSVDDSMALLELIQRFQAPAAATSAATMMLKEQLSKIDTARSLEVLDRGCKRRTQTRT